MAPVHTQAEPAGKSVAASSPGSAYTRLHITPLDADLLKVVVPSSVLPLARNISFHTIETFPEKRYGYVDLPEVEADKLRKKLNGALLRGTKIRIARARPEAIPTPMVDDVKEDGNSHEHGNQEKRTKRGRECDKVAHGLELVDRKIVRGWTVAERDMIREKKSSRVKQGMEGKGKKESGRKEKGRKEKVKSKYTDAAECLFKQKLPNAISSAPAPVCKNGVEPEIPKRQKRKGKVLIHEFENTVKYPTFLRSTDEAVKTAPPTFDNERGWVDAEGKVVEPVRPRQGVSVPAQNHVPTARPEAVAEEDTSSSDSSSDEEGGDRQSARRERSSPAAAALQSPTEYENNDGGSSSHPEDVSEGEEEPDNIDEPAPTKKPKLDTSLSSSGPPARLHIKIPPATPAAHKIHPLEALYKVRKDEAGTTQAPAPEAKPFRFFDHDDESEDEAGETMAPPAQVPMTPFSRADLEHRRTRSAAPTPDTAHPCRSHNPWGRRRPDGGMDETADDEDEAGDRPHEAGEQDGCDEDTAMAMPDPVQAPKSPGVGAAGGGSNAAPKSEFEAWFWEHRGDLSRSWKRRRKSAGKERRNRQNHARAARAI